MPKATKKAAVVSKDAKPAAKVAKTAATKAAKPAKAAKAAKAAKVAQKKPKLSKEAQKVQKKISRKKHNANPLFEKRAKVFAIGRDINTQRDVTRYVLWPKYVRLQRQRKILYSRVKVPPAIHQFSKTLDKNTAIELFKLLLQYKPETKRQEKNRLVGEAAKVGATRLAAKAKFAEKKTAEKKAPAKPEDKKALVKTAAKAKAAAKKTKKEVPHKFKRKVVVKCGVNHVTSLVESKRAKLVLIANDVDPVELVVWLPALCRKMNVPYCIVKNKARLGKAVGKKNATCLAFTAIKPAHRDVFF